MKFEKIRFHGKHEFTRNTVHQIMNQIDDMYPGNDLSPTRVNRYVEILLDDQDFNPKTHVFYDKNTNRKLTHDFLANIAYQYILEHLDEFKKIIIF